VRFKLETGYWTVVRAKADAIAQRRRDTRIVLLLGV
jgi:hypothetical protein